MSAAPETPELDLSWLDLYDDPTSAEPTKKGLTLDAIDVGDYASREELPRDMTPRLRGASARENAHRQGLTYQTKGGRLGGPVPLPLRRGAPAPVVLRARHPWDTLPGAARREGTRHVPGRDHARRGRVHRRRRPRPMAARHQRRRVRGGPLPDVADHGRGAPHGRVPQARPGQRRRPPAAGRRAGAAQPDRSAGLHRDVGAHARAGGRLRAVDVPHGRADRADAGGQAHLPHGGAGRVAPPRLRCDAPEARPLGDARAARGDPPLPRQGRGDLGGRRQRRRDLPRPCSSRSASCWAGARTVSTRASPSSCSFAGGR